MLKFDSSSQIKHCFGVSPRYHNSVFALFIEHYGSNISANKPFHPCVQDMICMQSVGMELLERPFKIRFMLSDATLQLLFRL